MRNNGKIFEDCLKKSMPDYALVYRLPDSAQSFGRSENLRFSKKNPFDFFVFDSIRGVLYGIEAKTVKGKSISFEREKDDSAVIHYHQIQGLNEYNKYENTVFGFVIEFRDIETTIFLDIESFNKLVSSIDKKSFTYEDICKHKIKHTVIEQKKLRTRYTYDIDKFLKNYKRDKNGN